METEDTLNRISDPIKRDAQAAILLRRHQEELQQTDLKLVIQLDQKVCFKFI